MKHVPHFEKLPRKIQENLLRCARPEPEEIVEEDDQEVEEDEGLAEDFDEVS